MIRTRTVSFPCPEELLPAIDNFKDLGITKSRAETLADKDRNINSENSAI
jgi:hypothetical protein